MACDNALREGVSDGEIHRGKPLIKLDPWHVKHRLIQPAHVANGTYGPWCIHVSKAFAVQHPELFEALQMVVRKRHPGWSEQEAARSLYGKMHRKDGSYYLQHHVATLLLQHGRRHQNHPTRNPFWKSTLVVVFGFGPGWLLLIV